MDKFKNVVRDYNKLMDYKYDFCLSDGQRINLVFHKKNLPHLIGFQYYNNVHPLFRDLNNINQYKVTSTNIFDKLEKKKVTYESINSSLDNYLKNRINMFTYLNISSLLRESTSFKFIYDAKKTLNNKAKYVFIENKSMYLHFYIGYDINGFYYPNSFSPNDSIEENIDDNPVNIDKTIITHIPSGECEIIEHTEIKKITQDINRNIDIFNKHNTTMYQELSKEIKNETLVQCSKDLAEKYFRKIIVNWNDLKEISNVNDLFKKQMYSKIRKFQNLYKENLN